MSLLHMHTPSDWRNKTLKEKGIKAHSTALTAELAKKMDMKNQLRLTSNYEIEVWKYENRNVLSSGKDIQKIISSYGYHNTTY